MKYLATLLLAALLLVSGCGDAPKATVTVSEGSVIPSVTLTGLDGSSLNLDSLRGKLVVLHVWATWCAPCRVELPGLDRFSKSLDPDRFVVLGLSIDEDANLVREFNLKYGIDFARHIDVDNTIAKPVFGIIATPETFIISPDGKLLRRMIGDQPWDTPAMKQLLEQAYNGQQGKSGAYW